MSEDLGPIVRLGVLQLDGVHVVDTWHSQAETPLIPLPSTQSPQHRVRAMYRRLGIDPTRTRPSSEALLRRVRRGEPLPRINTLVDACNLCSLETQLPYGLYDLGRVEGRVSLRVGQPGDGYSGIRKHVVHVAGRLALFDERGPFGNPTSDSARTMVTGQTTRVSAVVFAPRSVPRAEVEAVLELTTSRLRGAAGGQQRGRWVVGDTQP